MCVSDLGESLIKIYNYLLKNDFVLNRSKNDWKYNYKQLKSTNQKRLTD